MTTLAEFHDAHGAKWAERGARSHVVAYGDPAAEAAAARRGCGLVDRSAQGKLRLTGADRVSFLNGMVTNDVKKLAVGGGCYAALLTPKGKMISDCRILVRPDHLFLDVEPERAAAANEFLASHVISEDVEVAEVSAAWALLSLRGPRALDALAALSDEARALASQLVVHGHAEVRLLGEGVLLIAAPLGVVPGYDLLASMGAGANLAAALVDKGRSVGVLPIGFAAHEMLRIEQGVPRYGADMDEETIPLEAGITNRAISFDKGCYVGQEIIARVAHRGHVNRHLVNLRFEGAAPKPGDPLMSETDPAPIGSVTSAVTLPTGCVGLGYVRVESAKEGTRLKVANGAAIVGRLAG